jgi:Ca2+-binding RTX toxin-like protein
MQGRLDVSHQSVTMDPSYSLLDGASIGAGSSGGPVWISGTDGAGYVVGLVSSEASDGSDTGYFTQITTSDYDQIESWVAEDEAASSNATLTSYDTTTASSLIPAVVPYTGPVAGLTSEYINITSDSLSVTALSDNWFIHSGSGTDAIAVLGGTNVLDGGTGSNFMTGGSGTDTFFLDDRAAAADIWSTIVNFHAGDDATLWGVTASDFSFLWANGQGAAGYHGLTLHATAAGKPEASLTLTGFTQTDLTNGRLSVSYGTDQASGSTYMMVHANT